MSSSGLALVISEANKIGDRAADHEQRGRVDPSPAPSRSVDARDRVDHALLPLVHALIGDAFGSQPSES